ncbi:serine/threonine-protein phosphatase 2A 55 kDa regulatory subunit B alpha isoform isoform X2, partial [Tachysurus ichikawai]
RFDEAPGVCSLLCGNTIGTPACECKAEETGCAGGGGNDMQWCFSQVKGAIDDDVAEDLRSLGVGKKKGVFFGQFTESWNLIVKEGRCESCLVMFPHSSDGATRKCPEGNER